MPWHAMAAMLVRPRNTEKTSAVVGEAEDSGKTATQSDSEAAPPAGHGRNGVEAFSGAQKVEIAHQNLKHGDRCPECGEGNVIQSEGAEGTGADCGAGAAGGHRLRARAVALRHVWASVHRAGAGRSRSGKVRRDRGRP